MVKFKKPICVLLSILMIMECGVGASASIKSENADEGIRILKEDCEFNDEILHNIFELTLAMLDEGKSAIEDLSIGESISVYNVEEESMFNICPVLNSENECIMMAQISDNGNVSVNDDIQLYKDVLENVNKGKESIVYISGGVIYIEDRGEKIELKDTGYDTEDENEVFDTYTFDEKLDEIMESEDGEVDFEKYGSDLDDTETELEMEETVNEYGARYASCECKIKKFVKQGSYKLCWAATTATIVNYKKKNSLSAKDVADAMNIGYNAGAGSGMVKSALAHYGVNYEIKSSKVSWSTVKNKIKNKNRPLCMGLSPISSAAEPHMVTIYGYAYDTAGSDKIMKIWDSNGVKTGIKYKTRVNLHGYEFRWSETLC